MVALAGTAMPFAHSAEDEAERWLRALRLHGQVGSALQALGVGESPLMTGSDADHSGERRRHPGLRAGAWSTTWSTRARRARRRARTPTTVGTADLLFAVLDVYGRLFDRALYLRGHEPRGALERLATSDSHHDSRSADRRLSAAAARRPREFPRARRLLEPAAEVEEVVGARHHRHEHHRVDERLDPGGVVVGAAISASTAATWTIVFTLPSPLAGMTTPCWPAAMRSPLTANSRAMITIATQAATPVEAHERDQRGGDHAACRRPGPSPCRTS